MIEVGPPPKQPLPSGGAAALPARPGAAAIPVQLVQPTALPEALPANGTLAALVEPGGQAGILSDLLQLSTDQGPLTIQSPLMLAAGTRVTLQLATIAGRAQLFLIPPRPGAEARSLPGKPVIAAATAKPGLAALVPGRAVTATVVRGAARGGEAAPPPSAEADSADIAATAPEPATAATPPEVVATAATAMTDLAAGAVAEPSPPAAGEPPNPAPVAEQDAPGATAASPATTASTPAAAMAGPARAAPAALAAAPTPAAAAAPAAAPPTPSTPVAAGQAFAGMATGQQLTLTVLAVTPNASGDAQSPGAAEPVAQPSPRATSASAQTPPSPRGAAAPPPVAPAIEAAPGPAAAAKPVVAGAPPPQSSVAETQAPPATAPTAAQAAVGPVPSVASSIATPAAAALSADAITVTASVVGSDAAGQPILEAGSVLLVLEAKAPPVGSEILLALPRLQGESAPPPNTASAFAPLEEVARAAAAEGGALQQAINTLLPRPGPALAAQLALYVGALRQGSAASWLGSSASEQLDKIGKGRTSQRLAASFTEAAQANSGADRAAGWLSLTLPMADAGIIQPIQLYIQRRRDEEEKGERPDTEQGRRFLIDFTLTRLGGIQLDGLARAGRLDLIVRTGLPMAPDLRGDLDRLFADVTSARGLAGALIFQVAPPVAPIPRALPQQQVGGILV